MSLTHTLYPTPPVVLSLDSLIYPCRGDEECCGGRMKHLLRDMNMIVAKKEKLQLVIQFAGSGSLKA